MQVNVSTLLNCPAERAWREVQTSRLLRYISQPLVDFQPITPAQLPETWADGQYLVRMRLWGFLPFGKHWIVITKSTMTTKAGKSDYAIRDNGHGELIMKWDHLITIRETPEGSTHYTDNVEIAAGLMTIGVWLFASVFYRYRQWRWRKLVDNRFDYSR